MTVTPETGGLIEPVTSTESPKVKPDGETEQEIAVDISVTVKDVDELDAPSWVSSPPQLAETLHIPTVSGMYTSL